MITGKYKELYNELICEIPSERLLHDALSTLAFGTDASFYRLIPKLIVKVHSESELQLVLKLAHNYSIPVTFRAAGTSLSGQAISDSVLVIASHGWQNHEVLNNGNRIKLQVGLKGAQANRYLLKYGRKIGPDPASIDSAMIGGIAANNASGMCCGTSENSYKTVADIRIVLSDGTVLDTASSESRAAFIKHNGRLLKALEQMASNVQAEEELCEKIKRKYKIKNTTGYSLNALVDYSDGFDILKHLMIGSEGTLAFISDITYDTVIDHQNKALALAVYPSMELACKAVQRLKDQPVSAVELMDRAAIRSVDSTNGVPDFLKTISKDAAVLLIETKAESSEQRRLFVDQITKSIEEIETERPFNFTKDSKEQALLWKIRKETLPTVAGMRKSGTTSLIEDVCFPVPMLASATLDLQALFAKYGYSEAVIFGHALEGNLHFMFSPNFNDAAEVERYGKFMVEVAELVVDKYDGSLKAEHGTGRNMAPFVEKEWGARAYQLMKEIKQLFDPKGILNPGVILNEDSEIHLKNLKPMVSIRETADKCMECGFCEGSCVSEGFSLSPRQRVVVFREMERLKISGQEPHRAAELHKLYNYSGLATCATDGLCYVACPVKIDTGKLVKELRHENHAPWQEKIATSISNHMALVTSGMRLGLNVVYYLRVLAGTKLFGFLATGLNKISRGMVPLWNEHVPKGAKKITSNRPLSNQNKGVKPANKVVYFPSCITRSMGVSNNCNSALELTQLTEMLLTRAGFEILYPKGLNDLCCGMAFSSKGFVEAGKMASDKLEAALLEASQGGEYPILCDMSPCLYTMKTTMGDRLKLYEPAEFIHDKLMDKLTIRQLDKKVAVFAVCSAKKMDVDRMLYSIASKCANEVVVIDSNCCGFAGDRGFILPELNAYGLRHIKEQSNGCEEGYDTSRTCEIGLSKHGGLTYSSILYLVEEASR